VNSYLVYRATFYLLMVVATIALTNEAGEAPSAKFYPIAVAGAAALAFCTVDRAPRWGLPRQAANLAALATMGVLYFEYKLDDSQMIRSLGHWLVYLMLIKFFLPKTAVDDWFLIALALMQLLIAAVISQSEQIGTWLILWGMLAIWVLSQFFLQREAQRLLPAQVGKETDELRKSSVDPYRGLYTFSYLFASLRMMVATLAVGGLIFLVLPRQAGATRGQTAAPIGRHLTGFDDEVQLGQLGEILENDSVVMTIELSDENGKPIRPETELLWRGVTLLHYEKGRWRRQSQRTQTVVRLPPDRGSGTRRLIRQAIKLEANDSNTLFAIRPVRAMDTPQGSGRLTPYMNPIDGTLFRPDSRGGPYDYIVHSDADPNAHQRNEVCPSEFRTELLLSIPEEVKARLRKIAEPIVAGISPDGPDAITRRAHALEAYLRDSGQFSYSLRMDIVDPTLDPVEDFLINRKEGHCEYYASALALLLRSVDIPARIVNGFKGGDFSELTQTINVRQKHAHSWVEAYAGPEPDTERIPIWIVLDPTPGTERQQSIAHVGGIARNFRPITDVVRHIWVFYVVGYDGDRQNRLVYAPMREMVREMQRQYRRLGRWLASAFSLFHFRDVSAFISVRGFVVTFIACGLLAGLAQLGVRLTRLFMRWLRGPQLDTASMSAGLLFYRRMAQLLAEYELNRTPNETQSEFAKRARTFLTSRGPSAQAVCNVPQHIVDAFYRVRFGHLELEPAYLSELNGQLDFLESSLKNV
jgi:transglutaminase-like putative cysteine protease